MKGEDSTMADMIPNLESYFRERVPEGDEILKRLEKDAAAEGTPIVGPTVGELLFILARVTGAERILELGTATGYSAIHLARGAEPTGGTVTTVESNPEMAARARQALGSAGLSDRVTVVEGSAESVLPTLSPPFDLVFLDIDKEGYLPALAHCTPLTRPGGLLVADNVGFAAADPFNRAIFERPEWRAVSLLTLLPRHSPDWDGLCLAARC